jgi:tetratricopeptide (TPR) repeat protein
MAMHEIAARYAISQQSYDTALAEYQEMLDLDPANAALKLRQASILLILGRFRESIARYEEALPVVAQRLDPERFNLASAYVSLGDEAGATRVLRLSGVPEAEIRLQMDKLREIVKKRRQ